MGAAGTWLGGGLQRCPALPTAGRAPRSRSREGVLCVEIGSSGEKCGARSRAAAVEEGLPAALGGARLAAKSGQAAAAVCAKFWVARKGTGEGCRAEPVQVVARAPGRPSRAPRGVARDRDKRLLLPSTPSEAGLTLWFNPSRLGGNNFIRVGGGWTQAGWAVSRLLAQSCGLAHFPSLLVFFTFLSTSVSRNQASWPGVFSPPRLLGSVILPLGLLDSCPPLRPTLAL